MKLFMCCLLFLTFLTMVLTAPVRAQRENVLSFLNDALDTTTTPAAANKKTPSKPITDKDSEDVSDAKSSETSDTNGFSDADESLESHETLIPKDVASDNTPSEGKKVSRGLVDISRLVQDDGSKELTHFDSEESTTAVVAEHGYLSRKQMICLNGDKVIDSASLSGKARRVNGLNGMLAPDQSGEMQDWDSVEENNGRLAAAENTTDTDETREYNSSEMYPIAPPEHKPRNLFVPAKSQ